MAEAIIRAWVSDEPPTVKGSGDLCEQQGPYLTVVGVSSAAIQIAHVPAIGECFVTFVISDNPLRMHFGSSSVAAADANSVLFAPGKHRLRITADRSYFRHFGVAGVAGIEVYRSSR